MATIANVIKWVSNIEEFRAQMKSGVDQVVAMESAVEKTVRSLGGEGLIRSANNAAAAVEKLGGAEKLTAGESERLAGMMDKAITKYTALGQTAPSALQRLLDSTRANVEQSKKLADETAAVQRNVSQFSGAKVISEAHAMATAIGQVGGANKLTAGEQTRVNALVTEAIAKYQALGKEAPNSLYALQAQTSQLVHTVEPLPKHLQNAGTAASGASKWFGDLGTQVKSTLLGFVGAQAIIGAVSTAWHTLTAFISSSIESFANAEAAQKKLTTALTAQGNATPGVIQQYDDLATSFQKTTVYGDDLINEMQALLVQVGQVMPSQMRGALKASTDLASGLGIDLRDATMLVAKAFSGGGDELGRLKVILGDAYVAGMGFEGMLAAIEKKFGGQAQAQIETYAGKIAQLTNEWDNFKEAVGKAIVLDPTVALILKQLTAGATGSSKGVSGIASVVDVTLGSGAAAVVKWLDSYSAGVLRAEDAQKKFAAALFETPAPQLGPLREGAQAVATFAAANANAWRSMIPPSMVDQIKTVLADWKPLTEEQKAAAAAAKQHAEAIRHLADAYSGTSAIKAAKDALAAVNVNLREGKTIAMMTREEQNRLNDTVKAAIEVYKAEGRIVPPELRKIFDETHHLRTEMEALALIKIDPIKKLGTNLQGTTLENQIPLVPRSSLIADIGLPTSIDLSKVIVQTRDQAAATEQQAKAAGQAAAANHTYADSLDDIAQSLAQLSKIGGTWGQVFSGASGIVSNLSAADRANKQFGGNLGIASAMFSSNASASQKWASGIASGAQIASGAMEVWAATANDGSKAAGTFHGAMAGAKAGAAFGPYGMAIGAAAGAVIGFIHTLSAGRRAVKDFAKSFDTEAAGSGFDELHAKMGILGADGERLWIQLTQGTKKGDKAGAQKVIDEITKSLEAARQKDAQFNTTLGQTLSQIQKWGGGVSGALRPYLDGLAKAGRLTQENIGLLSQLTDDGKVSWQQLEEAVGRYGGDISKLGGTFQEARMHDSWQQIIDDMDLFQRGGVSANDALGLMSGKISDLVNQSIKFGTEIPANMKPWVEQLMASGKLVDENGNKITDIGKLKFGETLQTSLQNLNNTLKTLIETFQKVPGAVNAIPKNVDTTVTTHHRDTYENDGINPNTGYPEGTSPASTGGYVGMGRVLAFALGGEVPDYLANGTLGRLINFIPKGTDTVPAMLTPGEIVLNAAQQENVAGSISATREPARRENQPAMTVVIERDGRKEAEWLVPYIPGVVRRYKLA